MFSIRQANKYCKKFKVQSGDVIIIKSTVGDQAEVIKAFQRLRDEGKLINVIIITVDNIDDINRLSHEQMKEHGWYRLEDAISTLQERMSRAFEEKKAAEEKVVPPVVPSSEEKKE